MNRSVLLILGLLAVTAGSAESQRPVRRTKPPPPVTGPTARFRCWSERPEDCAAIAQRLAGAAGVRKTTRTAGSGWTEDLEIVYRRESSVAEAAKTVTQQLNLIRPHRFEARATLQGARRQWSFATSDAAPGGPPATARSPQGDLAKMKERTRAGDLELALAGEGGKTLTGVERQVDGVVRNLGPRPLTVQLARGCDLDVAVTARGSARLAALSPCGEGPDTLRIAPADSFVFRGADLPSDVSGSYLAYATLFGNVNGEPVRLRTPGMRVEFRKAGRQDVAAWATPLPDCVPPALPKLTKGELAGSYMLALREGVDAAALAKRLSSDLKAPVTLAAARYLNFKGDDAAAARLGCLAGVERVIRDVESKK